MKMELSMRQTRIVGTLDKLESLFKDVRPLVGSDSCAWVIVWDLMGENHLSDEQDVRENQIGLEATELEELFDEVRPYVGNDSCAWLVTKILREQEVQDKTREYEKETESPETY